MSEAMRLSAAIYNDESILNTEGPPRTRQNHTAGDGTMTPLGVRTCLRTGELRPHSGHAFERSDSTLKRAGCFFTPGVQMRHIYPGCFYLGRK